MSQLSGNSCNIITILPMVVECESINASTPQASNGMVSIFVTGGTPPYTTTWSNGSQGSYIFNLSPGSYTATTTDYYKDFTATTVCTVGTNTFILDKFQNCTNSSEYVYYLGQTPPTYTPNKIYELQNIDGCWINFPQVLYTGQTYFDAFATTISGPSDQCCQEPPTPVVLKPNNLCMTVGEVSEKQFIITYIPFSTGSTINGKESWTSTTTPLLVYYNSGTTKWSVSGWTYGGVPTQNDSPTAPLGAWVVLGNNITTMEILEGPCILTPTLSVTINNSSCEESYDGSIYLTGLNGTPPYLYSLDGVIYGVSNMFIGLGVGNYTVYVKDSANQVSSQNVTINAISSPVIYDLNLIQNPQEVLVVNNIAKYTQSTNNVQITVTPPLPNNKILTFDLVHSTIFRMYSGIDNNVEIFPTLDYVVTTGSTSGTLITGYTQASPASSVVSLLTCPNANNYLTGSTETYNAVFSGSNSDLTFNIVKKITTPDADEQKCSTYGFIKDTFQIINPRLINQNRCESFGETRSLSFETERTGNVSN